jgi:SpoVK/Ycf46/Vps4 family AAA+-type ATPase
MQDDAMELRDFTRFLNINSIDAIQYKPHFERLIEKRYLISTSRTGARFSTFFSGKKAFKVDETIVEAIMENKPISIIQKKQMDVYEFNQQVSDLINERDHNDIDTADLFEMIKDLEEENTHLEFINELTNFRLNIEDRTLIYEMGDDFITGGFTALNITLKDIYGNVRERMARSREILDEENPLFMVKLISITDGSFHNDTKIELTEKSQQILFGEDLKLFQKKQSIQNVIKSKDIQSKELFFEESTKQQIDFITNSLNQEKFIELQTRLKRNNLPNGVAAVFYGSPGTGKSESAYQLARATGRDIIAVDLSNTKSMWFGQSEKKIKEIFTDYYQACQRCEVKPILLFNEADGVLSKRTENKNSSTHQTENTIQNILLEEFEKNQGIIIATTNLEKNLDAAFERRFLFKVKFEKPTTEVRKQIWLNKMSWINDEVLNQIVDRFNFSGGEIDNIFRKVVMHEVTTGLGHNSTLLLKFCESEKFENHGSAKRLGYF